MFVVGYNRCRRFARQLSNKYCDWKKSSFSGSFKQIIEISLIGTGGACMFRFDQYNYCQLSKGRNESVLNNMHCANWYNVNTCIYKCKREREKTINTSFLCSAMHSVFVPFNSSVPLFTIHKENSVTATCLLSFFNDNVSALFQFWI